MMEMGKSFSIVSHIHYVAVLLQGLFFPLHLILITKLLLLTFEITAEIFFQR